MLIAVLVLQTEKRKLNISLLGPLTIIPLILTDLRTVFIQTGQIMVMGFMGEIKDL